MAAVFEMLQTTEDLRAAAGSWFSRYAYDIQTRYNAYALALCRDALRRGAPDEALAFVRTVLKSEPSDAEACELLNTANDMIRQRGASRRGLATASGASS